MSAYNRVECEDGTTCVVKPKNYNYQEKSEIMKTYQEANTFWAKYKWWIILILVLLVLWFLFSHHKKSDMSIQTENVYLPPTVRVNELLNESPQNMKSLFNFA